ncbi:probable G-protein coupled receptor Mth-like 2 [Epargyreus clarus]|uniref:probable G-protein coupled receptor Mth-like 2 n=1 Tax=Epargyreus clarus TaxID=520877 RepID=UPI003C306026
MKGTIFLLLISCGLTVSTAPAPCCPNNEVLRPRGICGDKKVNMSCPYGKMLLRDVILDGYKLSTVDSPLFVFADDPSQYCLGRMYRNLSMQDMTLIDVALVCFSGTNDVETSGVLTLVSVVFLVATFAIYLYLPQMRDLQGLCYMCMCLSMALGFLSLGLLQLSPGFSREICTVVGFLVYFWMMATFFWMNVISINVYRTIEDPSYLKKTQKKQYVYYNCYAWGFTFFFLIVSLSTNFIEGSHWKPGIGAQSCWFNGRTETWIFFYGPIAVLITVNVLLFIISSLKLWRHTRKYEVNKLNNLKHRFLESLKLFLVMGISWIFEIASFAHGERHIIWKIMDTFNCLQGIVIFLILVLLRKRAMKGLADENCCLIFTRPLAEKLSPHDDEDDEQILADETMEVRLN